MIICPHCSAENPDGAQYCNLCWTSVGFENIEYPTGGTSTEGYLDSYPSSFNKSPKVPGRPAPSGEPEDKEKGSKEKRGRRQRRSRKNKP